MGTVGNSCDKIEIIVVVVVYEVSMYRAINNYLDPRSL
jgi:hypothetical protein